MTDRSADLVAAAKEAVTAAFEKSLPEIIWHLEQRTDARVAEYIAIRAGKGEEGE